jgi:hypothetical protein
MTKWQLNLCRDCLLDRLGDRLLLSGAEGDGDLHAKTAPRSREPGVSPRHLDPRASQEV